MDTKELHELIAKKKALKDAGPELLKAAKELQMVLDAYSEAKPGLKLKSDWAMEMLVARDNLAEAITKAEG